MVKIGKVYKNFMIDVKPTNEKLKNRAVKIVAKIAEVSEEQALFVLKANGYKIKHAVLNLKYGLDFDSAEKIIVENDGVLRKIFLSLHQDNQQV